jgi:hypothetical protein
MPGDTYKLHSLKSQVDHGEYRVDPPAVADAMLRWYLDPAPNRRRGPRAQNECSKPDRGSAPSVNTTAGGPSTTDPISVKSLRWNESA